MERWAELRREYFVRGVSIKELMRRTGLARNTIRVALRSDEPPAFRCPERPSKLDPFKEEVCALLRADPRLPGVRVRELIEPLGFEGGKTIVDDYLREVRPLFKRERTYQRTVYRPGEVCQGDLWETSEPVAVGHGQTRRAWVVVCCLGYSRAGAGALIFSKEAPDVLWGMGRCLWSLGALPELLVWDREGCLHAGGGRPTDVYAAFCGLLKADWYFCEAGDAPAKGAVERLQGYLETNFEPGRRFANPLDYQLQLDCWFEKANARTHKTLRCRPVDRLLEEREVMRALPEREPDVDRRWVTRVPADPSPRPSKRSETRRSRSPRRETGQTAPSRLCAAVRSLRSALRAFATRADREPIGVKCQPALRGQFSTGLDNGGARRHDLGSVSWRGLHR